MNKLGLKDNFQFHFTHAGPCEVPPDEISNPSEFNKHLTESGIASEGDLVEIDLDLLTIHPPGAEEIRNQET